MFHNILVLCTGNICRSPIAEALFRDQLPKDRTVLSAGTAAVIGAPADPYAVEVSKEHGLDLTAHRGQQASLPLLKAADLVVVMTRAHADWVHQRLPGLRGRVHLLGRWRDHLEIADPYGMPRDAFSAAYAQIEQAAADWIPRLT